MKAVVFAAGIGSRLKPFTDFHPKALAEIAGKPILGHVLDKLIAAGADDIVVNVHHFADQIEVYLASRYPGVKVSDESSVLLDTAGGLAKIYRESAFGSPVGSGEPILVHNADIYTDFRIEDMLSFHEEGSATLLVDYSRTSTRELLFDDCKMRGWRNLKTGEIRPEGIKVESLIGAPFGGVHIISGNILKDISEFVGSELKPCSITDYYIEACPHTLIRPYAPEEAYRWFDIGTSQKLEAARQAVEN